MAAIAVGSMIGKGVEQYNSEQASIDQINLQSKYQKMQYLQKQTATYDSVQKLLATQTAVATTRGYSLDSASFNAIQRNTSNVGAKTLKNLDVEENLYDMNERIEKQNVHNKFMGDIFGDVSELAQAGYSMGKNA